MTKTTKTHDRLATEALEVVLTWGDSPLAQQLVTEGAVTLGPEGCTFLMPEEIVKRRFALACRDERGWTMHDGATLAKGDSTTRTFGELTFHLRVVDAPETTPRAGVQVDRQAAGFVGAVFGLASILVALSMMLPPNAAALTARLDGTQAHRLRVQLEALATPPVTETFTNEAGGEEGAHGGDAVASPSGGDGEPGAQENTGRSVMRRGTRATAPVTTESVREMGTFAGASILRTSVSRGMDTAPQVVEPRCARC